MHQVELTNNPTFDTTLYLSDLEMMMLPNMLEMTSVSWGGVDDYMVTTPLLIDDYMVTTPLLIDDYW